MKYDCLVLGAGMVGVSAAVHLQKRGQTVALVDRRPAAEETSYGNAGIIQNEGVMPYPFPRELNRILAVVMNRSTEAHLHWRALPDLAPWLYRYWRNGTAERILRTANAALPLVRACLEEHVALMEEAGATDLLRRTGYLQVYRQAAALDAAVARQEAVRERFGISFNMLDKAALHELEPHLSEDIIGATYNSEPGCVSDPSALGKAYAALFEKLGGAFMTADARTLEAVDGGWRVQTVAGAITARNAVVALGPWSGELLRGVGLEVPLRAKRGYHMHYGARGNATLGRPVLDTDYGYVLAPMRQGIRLTTGAEFAAISAPPTPVQLDRVEPAARSLFPLAERLEPKPWLGRRPCLPDMLPVIGAVPGHKGLWADFGHHHLGFTLGPVSGRLLAEMITGQATFTDPSPYRIDRF